MTPFRSGLREVNSLARLLMTVSPVPLTATAWGDHVLVATTYSKSVLRAVADDLAKQLPDAWLVLPLLRIISSHSSREMLYDPNLRTVNEFGVNYVMQHFFSGKLAQEFGAIATSAPVEDPEPVCDEEALDRK